MKNPDLMYICSNCGMHRLGHNFPKKGLVCKKCLATRARIKYQTDKEYRAKQSLRSRKAYKNNPDYYRTKHREYTKRKPFKKFANKIITLAIKQEVLLPEACAICGNVKSEAHHSDYSRPYDVEWLCREHHRAWHRVFEVEMPFSSPV